MSKVMYILNIVVAILLFFLTGTFIRISGIPIEEETVADPMQEEVEVTKKDCYGHLDIVDSKLVFDNASIQNTPMM